MSYQPNTSVDLTSLANVKAWLRLESTKDDDMLQRLITALSAYIQQWLNRTILTATYTETLNGTGSQTLVLPNYPVTAVSSLTINGQTIRPGAQPSTNGYVFDKNALYLIGYSFPKTPQSVRVSYSAGFAAVPSDLEQACIELLGLRYREMERIGHQSKSMAGETISFFIGDFPRSVLTILNQYKKVVPA